MFIKTGILVLIFNFFSVVNPWEQSKDTLNQQSGKHKYDNLQITQEEFLNPPQDDRLAVFWDWSNATDEEAIIRDLEEMARVGIGRAVLSITHGHSATVTDGSGMVFLSPLYLERFRFALDEAARLSIKITGIPGNGWYQGGPWVTPEMGAQMLVWSVREVQGPEQLSEKLPVPDSYRPGRFARIARGAMDHLKPVATLAYKKNKDGLLLAGSMIDLTGIINEDGLIDWEVPAGDWVIYRFGHVPNMVKLKNESLGYSGLQIDHFSREAMQRFLQEVAVPMLGAAGPHVGNTLDRLHEDSMELGHFDWTSGLPEFFKKNKHYDLIPYLPVLTGATFLSATDAERIIYDFESILDELLAEEHFGTFREFCHQHGVELIAESGPTGSGIIVKGSTMDHVMDEFWNHRNVESDHPVCFNRNAVFAAHVYGQNRNTCEAFTTVQHWLETPAHLKALANETYSMGLNHLTILGFASTPVSGSPPGDVLFHGTHFNPYVTWWDKFAEPLTKYFSRCQTMLTAGLPVTDMLYLDGPALQEMIKTNEMLREQDRRFWKYDGIPVERLVEAVSVNDEGNLVLPNGQYYKVLVIADEAIRLSAMQAVERLVDQGATVWFQAVPDRSQTYSDGPDAGEEIQKIMNRLGGNRFPGLYTFGNGKVLTGADRSNGISVGEGKFSRMFYPGMHAEAMDRLGEVPAFSYGPEESSDRICFFQREVNDDPVYFVANALRKDSKAECAFRVNGKFPERWDPVKGTMEPVLNYRQEGEQTMIPLEFAAHESFFIVFRESAPNHTEYNENREKVKSLDVSGPWAIEFDPAREETESFRIESEDLFLWDTHPDDRIASFSGTATYHNGFEVPVEWLDDDRQIILDLGNSPGLYELKGSNRSGNYEIKENLYDALCAEIIVNHQPAGVLWCAPYHLDISQYIHSGNNVLEIRVTNIWHNWRVANQYTPSDHPWEKRGLNLSPVPSGLLGPVSIELYE